MRNKKLRVTSVFGTRPEAIKMCPLVKKLQQCPEIESINPYGDGHASERIVKHLLENL